VRQLQAEYLDLTGVRDCLRCSIFIVVDLPPGSERAARCTSPLDVEVEAVDGGILP
jgi:hypothetical protein